jgi:hypothetical protein
LRKETELARAEIAEKADQVVRGIGFVVAGAALAIPGVVVLLGAAVVAMIDAGIDRRIAALAVGAAALLIGVLFAWIGARAMKAERLLPRRTIAHVQRDVSLAKNQLRPHHEVKRAA